MYLYHQTLMKSTFILKAQEGNFSGYGHNEVFVSKGKTIELITILDHCPTIVCSTEVFGIVRAFAILHVPQLKKDLLVIGSDSGYLSIVEYSPIHNRFVQLFSKRIGKPGCLRKIPGQYIQLNEANNMIIVGALEESIYLLPFSLSFTEVNSIVIEPLVEDWMVISRKNRVIISMKCFCSSSSSSSSSPSSSTHLYILEGVKDSFEKRIVRVIIASDYSDKSASMSLSETKSPSMDTTELILPLRDYTDIIPLPSHEGVVLCGIGSISYVLFNQQPFSKTPVQAIVNGFHMSPGIVQFEMLNDYSVLCIHNHWVIFLLTDAHQVLSIVVPSSPTNNPIHIVPVLTLPSTSRYIHFVMNEHILMLIAEAGPHTIHSIESISVSQSGFIQLQLNAISHSLPNIAPLINSSPILSQPISPSMTQSAENNGFFTISGRGNYSYLNMLMNGLMSECIHDYSSSTHIKHSELINDIYIIKNGEKNGKNECIFVSFKDMNSRENCVFQLNGKSELEPCLSHPFLTHIDNSFTPTILIDAFKGMIVQITQRVVRVIYDFESKKFVDWYAPSNRHISCACVGTRYIYVVCDSVIMFLNIRKVSDMSNIHQQQQQSKGMEMELMETTTHLSSTMNNHSGVSLSSELDLDKYTYEIYEGREEMKTEVIFCVYEYNSQFLFYGTNKLLQVYPLDHSHSLASINLDQSLRFIFCFNNHHSYTHSLPYYLKKRELNNPMFVQRYSPSMSESAGVGVNKGSNMSNESSNSIMSALFSRASSANTTAAATATSTATTATTTATATATTATTTTTAAGTSETLQKPHPFSSTSSSSAVVPSSSSNHSIRNVGQLMRDSVRGEELSQNYLNYENIIYIITDDNKIHYLLFDGTKIEELFKRTLSGKLYKCIPININHFACLIILTDFDSHIIFAHDYLRMISLSVMPPTFFPPSNQVASLHSISRNIYLNSRVDSDSSASSSEQSFYSPPSSKENELTLFARSGIFGSCKLEYLTESFSVRSSHHTGPNIPYTPHSIISLPQGNVLISCHDVMKKAYLCERDCDNLSTSITGDGDSIKSDLRPSQQQQQQQHTQMQQPLPTSQSQSQQQQQQQQQQQPILIQTPTLVSGCTVRSSSQSLSQTYIQRALTNEFVTAFINFHLTMGERVSDRESSMSSGSMNVPMNSPTGGGGGGGNMGMTGISAITMELLIVCIAKIDKTYELICYSQNESANRSTGHPSTHASSATLAHMNEWPKKHSEPCKHIHVFAQIGDNGLLVASGQTLFYYLINKSCSLELKSQIRCTESFITSIQVTGESIFLADNNGQLSLLSLNASKQLDFLSVREIGRSIMRMCVLDKSTIACADKFGSILITRTIAPIASKTSPLDLRTHSIGNMECLAAIYVGELITSMHLVSRGKNSHSALLYTTIGGSVGLLTPIRSINHRDLLTRLWHVMLESDGVSVVGRHPLDFRSYFHPSVCVVDGDVCKLFNDLSTHEQLRISQSLGLSIVKLKSMLFEFAMNPEL